MAFQKCKSHQPHQPLWPKKRIVFNLIHISDQKTSPNPIHKAINGFAAPPHTFPNSVLLFFFKKKNTSLALTVSTLYIHSKFLFFGLLNAKQGKEDEARTILERIYPAEEVEHEVQSLLKSIEQEKKEQVGEGGMLSQLKSAWGNDVVRRGLYAGITVQVAQQFVGINTVMYYSPTIIQFAGFASNKTALALSLITSGLNALGSIFSMCFVDRFGRRRLMIISMIGIISCLVVLSIVFFQASVTAPKISPTETAFFGANSTCQAYTNAPDLSSWGCMTCLQKDTGCGFCSAEGGTVSPNPRLFQSLSTLTC